MIGIPDAATLEETPTAFPKEDFPCMNDDILWDLTNCAPTWSETVDLSFIIAKVSQKFLSFFWTERLRLVF